MQLQKRCGRSDQQRRQYKTWDGNTSLANMSRILFGSWFGNLRWAIQRKFVRYLPSFRELMRFGRPQQADDGVQGIEQEQGDDENDPSPGGVVEAFRLVRVPVLNQQTGADDADTVGGDSDGDGSESEEPADPGPRLHEIAVDDGEREQ